MSFIVNVGATKERKVKINSNQTTTFLWEGENVFSTPAMISEMEETCRLLLKEQFIPNAEWDSVGTVVNIKHLAATPIGTEVLLKSKVISVNGRRVMFDVEAFDKIEKIGQGQHERFIINVPKFKNKFNEKIKQLDAA
ncbi:MAG: thioesterase family protein [Thermoproteota archaeon]|nr:thioesterase family protein [Thermoproteota archaeon]MDQ4022675.1 thioesterase family protein [Thermoproteota archaeon]